MKIAIPLANGQLAMHFGHCEEFALVDVDEATRQHRGTAIRNAPQPGLLPRWLHEQSEVIIAGGMGQRAQMLFRKRASASSAGSLPTLRRRRGRLLERDHRLRQQPLRSLSGSMNDPSNLSLNAVRRRSHPGCFVCSAASGRPSGWSSRQLLAVR